MGGRNDQMTQVSCLYALEKITKVGIVSGSLHSNVGNRESNIQTNVNQPPSQVNRNKSVEIEGSSLLDFAADVLEDPPGKRIFIVN